MTNEEARLLTKRAIKHAALCLSNEQDQEDIAQDAMMKTFQNPEWRSGMKMRVLDAIRTKVGRKGEPNYNQKTHHKILPQEGSEDVFEHLVVEKEPDPIEAFRELCHTLTGRDRCFIYLSFFWGLNNEEIAECFGVSGSLVCLELKRIIRGFQGVKEKKTRHTRRDQASQRPARVHQGLQSLIRARKERRTSGLEQDKTEEVESW